MGGGDRGGDWVSVAIITRDSNPGWLAVRLSTVRVYYVIILTAKNQHTTPNCIHSPAKSDPLNKRKNCQPQLYKVPVTGEDKFNSHVVCLYCNWGRTESI